MADCASIGEYTRSGKKETEDINEQLSFIMCIGSLHAPYSPTHTVNVKHIQENRKIISTL